MALWLLSLSPHYFFTRDREAESRRNAESRAELVDDLLAPYLMPDMTVIDFGCGPGYMAAAVAQRVREVEAVDISRGVLACARVLNGSPKVAYRSLAECAADHKQVDLVYSFAVFQHLTDEVAARDLCVLWRRLREGGTLILHFPGVGVTLTERERRLDRSVTARLRLHFALNVFGRAPERVRDMVTAAGFADISVQHLRDRTSSTDDIGDGQWLVATRPRCSRLRNPA